MNEIKETKIIEKFLIYVEQQDYRAILRIKNYIISRITSYAEKEKVNLTIELKATEELIKETKERIRREKEKL